MDSVLPEGRAFGQGDRRSASRQIMRPPGLKSAFKNRRMAADRRLSKAVRQPVKTLPVLWGFEILRFALPAKALR
jgi:hypothetical protein